MKNGKNEGLGHIRTGELIYYYPLKFDSSLDFSSLCNHIYKSVDASFSSCCNQATDILKADIQSHMDGTVSPETPQPNAPTCLFHDATFAIDPTPSSLKLEMHLGCMKAYSARDELIDREYNEYKKIYGDAFTSMQNRILLPPLSVTLYNGKTVWLQAILIVFKNKMGVLKLELPLINVSTEHFKNLDPDAYVESVIGGCIASEQTSTLPFSELHRFYIKKILACSTDGISQIFCGPSIFNIILTDCEGSPEKIEHISPAIQKDLFEIIAAPVSERTYSSATKLAEGYLENHSWGNHIMKCFLSTRGGCLTLIETAFINYRISECATDQSIPLSSIDESLKNEVHQIMLKSACINVEFALIILALKKMNNDYILREKAAGERKIYDIQAEYNQTLILIADLQRSCMGTVYEQLNAFERMMPYYLNSDLAETTMSAIDRIQASKETLIRERNQSLLSIISLVLTAVFGLPAIHDTISLLHTALWKNHADIPYLSIDSISIFCWFLLLICLIYWFYRTIQKSK